MRIAVLAAEDSWYLRDLVRAGGDAHQVVATTFSQMHVRLAGGQPSIVSGDVVLDDFPALLVRTMPPGSLEQVVFRMDVLGRLQRSGTAVINPARAIETSVDKFLASAKLQQAGLDVPRTICCQTHQQALAAFEELGRDVVVKPLFGGEGRGMTRISDPDLAVRAFRMLEQMASVIYLQEFIRHHGFDIRILLMGGRCFCMRRRSTDSWRTNISQGARAEAHQATDRELQIARRAAESLGVPVAGVDLLPSLDGRLYVLEVNAVPGWKALARVTGVDIAAQLLNYAQSVVNGAESLPPVTCNAAPVADGPPRLL